MIPYGHHLLPKCRNSFGATLMVNYGYSQTIESKLDVIALICVIELWHTLIAMLTYSCVALLPFTSLLPWPHGVLKCPLDVNFIKSVEVVDYPGTTNSHILIFHILLFTCYLVGEYAYLATRFNWLA